MSKIFFCSDLHFDHINILKYEPVRIKLIWENLYKGNQNKPEFFDYDAFKAHVLTLFESNEQNAKEELIELIRAHNELLISLWNNTVTNNDVVWFLGDFCFGNQDKVKYFMSRLNGNIKMIKGNHDIFSDKVYYEAGVKYVTSFPIILKNKFILSHAPVYSADEMDHEQHFINYYGHVHSSQAFKSETISSKCVCIERINFKPTLIKEFDSYINKREY